jgi:hypothetical protein
MSSQSATRSEPKNFMDMPPELRNKIYHALFDGLRHGDLPKATKKIKANQKYILATSVRPLLDIFAVSRTIYKETHGLFFADYFPRVHYALEGVRAVQAFLELPSTWPHRTSHQLQLSSQDADVGLAYAATLAQVLATSVSAMGSLSLEDREQWVQSTSQQPASIVFAPFFKSWDRACEHLELAAQDNPPRLLDECLLGGFNEIRIRRDTKYNVASILESAPCMHRIGMYVVIEFSGSTTWNIKGPLSLLDWSCVPKDLQVFLDKPSRKATPNDAAMAKALRIARMLEL